MSVRSTDSEHLITADRSKIMNEVNKYLRKFVLNEKVLSLYSNDTQDFLYMSSFRSIPLLYPFGYHLMYFLE